MIFRTFAYEDCMISNYVFTTLHDYDETFSGVTQFVYADVFEFECEGYHPSSPSGQPTNRKPITNHLWIGNLNRDLLGVKDLDKNYLRSSHSTFSFLTHKNFFEVLLCRVFPILHLLHLSML